ncbi:MAG: glycosyltransferase family 9 protein [Acidobacteriales bacterium]|nr:glycosyltransferase family 9 protein [Terriglobales bacterium]
MDYWVGIPLLNVLATAKVSGRRRRWPAEVARIGMMCSPALGDTLLFSAVLQDVRAHFPDTEIIHFCMRQNLAAAELIPGADRRVLIDLTRPIDAIRKIRSERVDVLLDFTSWQRLTAFYSLMSGARFTVGFQTAGQHRGRGYDVTVKHCNDQHEVENFRALVRMLGIPTKAEPKVLVPEVAVEPLCEEKDIVVLHPWAAGQQSWLREWPEERWIGLAQRIARSETLFVVTGSPADMKRSDPMVKRIVQSGLRAASYVSPDGFCSLAHLILRARVVVSVNTGVMHLAAILNSPTVSLNGPTAPHRWGPWGQRVASVRPSDGSGGFLNLGFEFNGHSESVMEKISIEDAEAAVQNLASDVAVSCNRIVKEKSASWKE